MRTKDEIKLLVKAICGYSPYKVKAVKNNVIHTITAVNTRYDFCELDDEINEQVEDIKLILRQFDSMTLDEDDKYTFFIQNPNYIVAGESFTDWLNRKKFDWRGLIPMGFALPAYDGIYND